MTLWRRYLIVVPLSVAMGWLAGRRLFPPQADATLPGPPPTAMLPPKPSSPEWRSWLDQAAPLPVPPDLETVWSQASASKKGMPARHRLWLDELIFCLPWTSMTQFLQDERFCELARTARVFEWEESDPSWRRRVMEGGVEEAMKLSGALSTIALNEQLHDKLLPALAREAPERGFAWLKDGGGDRHAMARFLEAVCKIDPEKATELWRGLEPGPERDHAVKRMMLGLKARDWKEGVAWAKANLPEDQQWESLALMLRVGGPGGRAPLFDAAAEMEDPAMRSLLYSTSLPDRSQNANDLMTQALALPANSLNARGWNEIGTACAWYGMGRSEVDPTATARNLRALAEQVPLEYQRSYLEGAALMGAYGNLSLATHLLEFLDEKGMKTLAEFWTPKDPTTASAWLTTLEPSPKRDAAVAAFCRETATVDPAMAAQWALSVGDPALQARAVQDALGAWRQLDPAAADAWAAEHVTLEEGR